MMKVRDEDKKERDEDKKELAKNRKEDKTNMTRLSFFTIVLSIATNLIIDFKKIS